MRTRLVSISLALSALAACNLYFGDQHQDHTPPPEYPDAEFITPDGNGGCCPPDAGSGSGSGCHTPDAGWGTPDAWTWPDAGSGSGWVPDAGPGPSDDGGFPYPDAGWAQPDGGCC